MDRPTEGHIRFGEYDLAKMQPHRGGRLGVGRTFQHSLVFDDMTVLDNVEVGRLRQGRRRASSPAL